MVRLFAIVLGCAIALSGAAALAQSSGDSVVYSFNGQNSASPEASLIDVGGTLYGTRSLSTGDGSVFSINPSTGAEHMASDPQASLLDYKGTLCGTVFSFKP